VGPSPHKSWMVGEGRISGAILKVGEAEFLLVFRGCFLQFRALFGQFGSVSTVFGVHFSHFSHFSDLETWYTRAEDGTLMYYPSEIQLSV
jgi:hypothetical protein